MYEIGWAVIAGLFTTPLGILWIISLCLARRKSDPARAGIAWLKSITPFWNVGCAFAVCSAALDLWVNYAEDSYYIRSGTDYAVARQASAHVAATGVFFEHLANILLFITLVELASGVLLCLNGGQPTASRKRNRIIVLVWGLVLFILAIANLGIKQSYVVRFFDDSSLYSDSYREVRELGRTLNRLGGAMAILMWLTSLPILALTSWVVHITKHHPILRSSSVLLLVSSILLFIRLTVTMAMYARYNLSETTTTSWTAVELQRIVSLIIEPFFNYTCMFVILVLLFTLGIRKAKGLWSVPQPGWPLGSVVYYAPGTVPVVPAQQYQQYPPEQAQAPAPGAHGAPPMQPTPGLPAYLAFAQQQQMEKQQQQQQQQQPGQMYYMPQQQPHQQQQYQEQQPQQHQGAQVANGFQSQV
ncbi:hypothetical protein VTK26DRAFT_6781 [Humicola hyalothermophila]